MLFKYLYVLFSDKYRNGIDSGLQIRQTSSLGFSNPFLGIVVAIENNAFMVLNDFLHYSIHFCFEILSLFEAIGNLAQSFSHNGIDNKVRCGDGL